MNKSNRYRVLCTILCLFLGSLFICARALGSPEEKIYYAIEINGQVFGYAELSILNIVDSKKYQPYLGQYKGRRGVITVSLDEGGLVLTLADKRVFGLREPDEKGEWLFKLSRDVGVTFESDASGAVGGLTILNRVRLPKKAEQPDFPDTVPENVRTYLGQYSIPMEKREINVLFKSGNLVIAFPGGGIRELEGPDAQGLWTAKSREDRFSFIIDNAGKVRTMILIETVRCTRID